MRTRFVHSVKVQIYLPIVECLELGLKFLQLFLPLLLPYLCCVNLLNCVNRLLVAQVFVDAPLQHRLTIASALFK